VPAITRVREAWGGRGLLYVGDCKMAALQTRAFLHAGAIDYWCRCRRANFRPRSWLTTWRQWGRGEQALHVIHRTQPDAHASGFAEALSGGSHDRGGHRHAVRWLERRLVIRSVQLAQAGERGLRARLANAQAEVTALHERRRGRRRCPDPNALREAVDTLLTRYRVQRPAARPV